jgi:hypothetical protein
MATALVASDLATLTDPSRRSVLLSDAKRLAARRFVCDLAVARDRHREREAQGMRKHDLGTGKNG